MRLLIAALVAGSLAALPVTAAQAHHRRHHHRPHPVGSDGHGKLPAVHSEGSDGHGKVPVAPQGHVKSDGHGK